MNFSVSLCSLCDVLDEDHCQLNFDKHELDEIKHCLNLTDDEF